MVVLTTRRPSAAMQLRRDVDRMMRHAFAGSLLGGGHLQSWTPAERWVPRIDMFERDNTLVIRAEVPGVDPEKDVTISVQDGTLTLKGERRREEKTEGERYIRFESSYGSFERSFPLPKGVDAEAITASHQHGVVEIVVPRTAEPAARTIPVTIGSIEPEAAGAKDTRPEAPEAPQAGGAHESTADAQAGAPEA